MTHEVKKKKGFFNFSRLITNNEFQTSWVDTMSRHVPVSWKAVGTSRPHALEANDLSP
jgi:hypothetical protein